MPNIGPGEIVILVVILLLVFGSRRLPEIGRSLGKGMREFKDSVTGKDEEPEPKDETPELTARAVEADEQPVGATSEKTDT
jgi:sec-independent protein translocase protein TatA